MGWIKRYRHGRGFGVHSPFAFSLITGVLREKTPYYDFDKITDRRSRMVYRLVCRFTPSVVAATGRDAEVALMADPRLRIGTPAEADLMITDTATTEADILDALAANAVVMLDKTARRHLPSALAHMQKAGYGMAIDNQRTLAILAPLPHLPLQIITARF